jgi:UDP-2,3-diacylglucosamine pyrophosphatase LpxH
MRAERHRLRARAVFISDLHLGSWHCQVEALHEFLENLRCEKLYLVGDVLDLWWIHRRRAKWTRRESQVLELFHRLPRRGTEVIYVPGNHDAPLRHAVGSWLGNVRVKRRALYTTAAGQRFLVTHGDEFDAKVRHGGWVELIGETAYDWLLAGNRMTNQLRAALGRPYWSLAHWIKSKSRKAETFVQRFVDVARAEARVRGLDGIVCGHIHRAALDQQDGVWYCNDGDWVESCTALVEGADGALSLIAWRGLPLVLRAQGERAASAVPVLG